jgi:hypothetical protein
MIPKLARRLTRWIAWKLLPVLDCSGCGRPIDVAPFVTIDGRLFHSVDCFFVCEIVPVLGLGAIQTEDVIRLAGSIN